MTLKKRLLKLLRRLPGQSGKPDFARLGMSLEGGQRIMAAKSVWMVLWLRSRRDGDRLRGYYRRMHFAQA